VSDGAEWIQGFVDFHRPDAVRILDFPHALGYVAQAGQAVYGEGAAAFTLWFTTQRQTLQHGDPEEVLHALQQLAANAQQRKAAAALATVRESLGYLEKRRAMLAYAWCDARGYPIGSGRVESANKLVVERRLKGAGMPWAWVHVNPMVALRAMACSDRWQEAWPQIAQRVQQQAWQARRQRQVSRRQAKASVPLSSLPSPPSLALSTAPAVGSTPVPPRHPAPQPIPSKVSKGPYRPPSNHPWRRFRISGTKAQQPLTVAVAKL
jgi:hypothetical protein